MSDTENKRPRGRPPLTPEQLAERKIEYNKRSNSHHKKTGYAAQRKYEKENPEQGKLRGKKRREIYNDIRVPILRENSDNIEKVSQQENKSIPELFILAFEEKYGITLKKD